MDCRRPIVFYLNQRPAVQLRPRYLWSLGEHAFDREGDFQVPMYEFECEKCKKPFTVGQTLREYDQHEKPKCPKCGSRVVRQRVTAVHVQTGKKS
jgi:putative FmdB family regulatory protein